MRNLQQVLTLGSLVIASGGCGDQASTAYKGEPLLSFSAQVEGADANVELEPVILFHDITGQARGGLPVTAPFEYEGDFPAGFSMHVYDPPPPEFLHALGDLPPMAGAQIVAVRKGTKLKRARGFNYVTSSERDCSDSGSKCVEVSWTYCWLKDRKGDDSEKPKPGDACYRETRRCEYPNIPVQDGGRQCPIVQSSGDPAFVADVESQLDGEVKDYSLLYLSAAVADGCFPAALADDAPALSAGYHLLHNFARAPDQLAAVNDCQQQRVDEILSSLEEQQAGSSCSSSGEPDWSITCSDASDETLLHEALSAHVLDCPVPGPLGREVVLDPESVELTMHIGPIEPMRQLPDAEPPH